MMHMPSFPMMVIIAVIGILLFGKRLPEVGRSLGKGIVEFKKGLKGIEEEVETASEQPSRPALPPQEQHAKAALPTDAKFDPFTGKPIEAKFDPYTGKPANGESTTTVSSGAPQENVAHS